MTQSKNRISGKRYSKSNLKSSARNRLRFKSPTNQDYTWISPLARKVRENSEVVSCYLAEILAKVASNSRPEFADFQDARWLLTKNITRMLLPNSEGVFSSIEKSLETLELAFGELSAEILRDSDVTKELLIPTIEVISETIETNPNLVVLLRDPEILGEAFGDVGERFAAILSIIPALSQKASDALPDLKEVLFSSLFQLSNEHRQQLYKLAEEILQQTYREHVFPKLEELLAQDPRGKVLSPILKGAIEAVPGESCLNAVLSMASTVRSQLTIGRVISIAIQKLGGLYVKISQVIAELSPPSLARELRTTQDDAGGLFPSVEQSWKYLLGVLAREDLEEWNKFVEIPSEPQDHFASASVGALYELKTSSIGRQALGTESVLIKLQRPGLSDLFRHQSNHLLQLCDNAQALLFAEDELSNQVLSDDVRGELLGIIAAIRRAILNYYKQSSSELDFNCEKANALRVAAALGNNEAINVPKFFYSSADLVIMERMPGIKITRIVQTKYLARRDIADSMTRAYLELLFEHGVVWADPHPGNILYDDVSNKVAMIDLNPCFVWQNELRREFKHLLYRLLLRDSNGVYRTLYELVENPEALQSNQVVDDLQKFLDAPINSGSLIRFVGEFIKTLSENGIDLKVEVQAALRGLSQLALTASSVSARNGFGLLLKKYFGLGEMLQTAWQVGLMRVIKVVTGLLYELTRHHPEEDVGPVLDERDISALSQRIKELARAAVCNIHFSRINPEDHPTLKMSADGSSLLVTSDLNIQILEKKRPATVRYVIDIPTREWLRHRQEFVKLASVARNFCMIECLEQLRRNSLDDYWCLVEAWNKMPHTRTVEEMRLVGEVKTAARKLYALRFAHIWETPMVGQSRSAKIFWQMLIKVECWREEAVQKYLNSVRRKLANVLVPNVAFSTLYRIKMLLVEAILWILRYRIKTLRYSMHLLPMTTKHLEDLILFGLSRNFTPSSSRK